MEIYLDNAATTPLSDPMKKYLTSILDLWGNPSSLYAKGTESKRIISDARRSVARFIHAVPDHIYFTPSGSACNTWAVRGYDKAHRHTVLYSPIAHKSILQCAEDCQYPHPLKTDCHGFIDLHDLEQRLASCHLPPFVIIDYANSEMGTIQDVERIIALTHSCHGIVYLDCTGSIPSIPIDVQKLNVDMAGFSAHKLGGLKGCGILYKKSFITLPPFIYGSQEQGLVGGTENILGIASAGKAVEAYDYSSIRPDGRDYVYNDIMKHIPDSYLIGAPVETGKRLPHNLYICFRGVDGESLMILLDMYGIQVSTGSACNGRSLSPSPALSAIGINRKDIHSCIRFSFSGRETIKELDYVCATLKQCVADLRGFHVP